MYKKILSLTLILLIAFACFSLSAAAYSPSFESVFKDAFVRYCDENGATIDEGNTLVMRIGSAGEYDVYRAYDNAADFPVNKIIGDYMFTHYCFGTTDSENPLGLYAYNGVELLTLEDAYESGKVDLDALYEEAKSPEMIPLNEEDALQLKCKKAFIEKNNITAAAQITNSDVTFAYQFDNYIVFRFKPNLFANKKTSYYLDGYWLYTTQVCEEVNPFGLYTLDNYGNIEPLMETVDNGFIEMDDVFPVIADEMYIYMSGDINNDRVLSIKDATLIQKYLAKFPEAVETVRKHPLGEKVMDYELNFATTPDVDIKDVTRIQYMLAGKIDTDKRPAFDYGEIIVSFYHTDVPEYTLEDFPEYDFKSIRINRLNAIKMVMIILELDESGKDNVINAINSLKYREGVEFDSVHPNWLFYPD